MHLAAYLDTVIATRFDRHWLRRCVNQFWSLLFCTFALLVSGGLNLSLKIERRINALRSDRQLCRLYGYLLHRHHSLWLLYNIGSDAILLECLGAVRIRCILTEAPNCCYGHLLHRHWLLLSSDCNAFSWKIARLQVNFIAIFRRFVAVATDALR